VLRTALKPRWIAGLLFAIAVSGVFVLLSQWQFGRSMQPEAPVVTTTEEVKPLTQVLQPGQFFPASVSDQMVSATGTYDPEKQVLVPGRLHEGEEGYWVVSAFAVDGAPALAGLEASPQTWIPVARGWVRDPAQAAAPPSGIINLTGRLLPSEAPLPNVAPEAGQASAVSVAELINIWNVSSYQGFVSADAESAGAGGALVPLQIEAQPPAQPVNWLNVFYSVEWIVFAGFALFIWWKMVQDDYRRSQEDEFDDEHDSGQHPGDEPNPQQSEQSEQKVQP
jgi:cytochrome oxidase assembly protein ShyY1